MDCVIVAVDRGSGRRTGWLSNYHLAVRDSRPSTGLTDREDDGFSDVGKTFKGFTDSSSAR